MKTSFSNSRIHDNVGSGNVRHFHPTNSSTKVAGSGDLDRINNSVKEFTLSPDLSHDELLRSGLLFESQVASGGTDMVLKEWLLQTDETATPQKSNKENTRNDRGGGGKTVKTSLYEDWKTFLPDTPGIDHMDAATLVHLVEKVWIPIMHRLNQDGDDNTVVLYSPHHVKVYHRLATVLLRMVARNASGDGILQTTRALARRILKEGRMKGPYGATHYYTFFTAIAAECSECMGDYHTAHLCYKSIDKMERSGNIMAVYGRCQVDVVGRSCLPLGMRSGNQHSAACESVMAAAMIPPTMSHAADSKIGNHQVPPGTLKERIRRTGVAHDDSSKSLVVGTFGDESGDWITD
jgi:hypothetical protein